MRCCATRRGVLLGDDEDVVTRKAINRRAFLAGGASLLAGTAGLWLGAVPANTPNCVVLEPRETDAELVTAQRTRSVYSYLDRSPAPDVRVKQGERLSVTLRNGLDEPTTLHWHGIRLPNAFDGVPFLTQPFVYKSETFDYTFVAL